MRLLRSSRMKIVLHHHTNILMIPLGRMTRRAGCAGSINSLPFPLVDLSSEALITRSVTLHPRFCKRMTQNHHHYHYPTSLLLTVGRCCSLFKIMCFE